MVGVGRERGILCAGDYVQACCHGAGSLCLCFLGLDSDHFWQRGRRCYSWSTERSSFLTRATMTASVGGREGRREEYMMRACEGVCTRLLALMPVGAGGGGRDGREQSPYFFT